MGYLINYLFLSQCVGLLNKFYDHDILYQAMCRDSRIVPGAAATEIELARRLKEFSFKETGCVYLSYLLMVTLCHLKI